MAVYKDPSTNTWMCKISIRMPDGHIKSKIKRGFILRPLVSLNAVILCFAMP